METRVFVEYFLKISAHKNSQRIHNKFLKKHSIKVDLNVDPGNVHLKNLNAPVPNVLIGTIKRTIFRKVRTETILKLYNTLVLPTFLYGSENWNLTASHRRRIEAAEMKLLRPLAGHTFSDHKTNDSIRRELQTECILDKDEYRRNWLLHLQRMPHNRIPLKSYQYSPQGKRTIGRPKKRSREQL